MDHWNGSRSQSLCAEPLEGRWFLSASSPTLAALSASVSVIDLKPVEEDHSDVEIARADLPQHVARAFDQRYPSAAFLEAVYSADEDGPEFEISAALNGRIVDVTILPDGQITQTDERLTSGELPPAVLQWIRQNFPGAEIDEATLVRGADGESYELNIAPPDQPGVEATLRVQDQGASETLPAGFDDDVREGSATFPSSNAADESFEAETETEENGLAGDFDVTAITEAFKTITSSAISMRSAPGSAPLSIRARLDSDGRRAIIEWGGVKIENGDDPFHSFAGSEGLRMSLAAKVIEAHGGDVGNDRDAMRVSLPLGKNSNH